MSTEPQRISHDNEAQIFTVLSVVASRIRIPGVEKIHVCDISGGQSGQQIYLAIIHGNSLSLLMLGIKMNQSNLHEVDWGTIPKPINDGAASHLESATLPKVTLVSTNDTQVPLYELTDWTVLYFYPMTGRPDTPLPDGWDEIPGARGCTPQSCSFRDHYQELTDVGVANVYGISTQSTDYQKEAANRLHLPFPLLSDSDLELTEKFDLPTFEVGGQVLIKRLTLICLDTTVKKSFYPVFPPHRNADEVLDYMKSTNQSYK